jgi:ribonuclease HII
MEKPTFNLEKGLAEKGFDFVIGVDEAGRGPLCGPVVACAVALRDTRYDIQDTKAWDLVRDSKKLSEKQREKAFDFIQENFYVGTGLCNHETIDRINILEASFLAMKKAVQELQRKIKNESPTSYKLEAKSCVLVDGNKVIPNFSMEQKAVIGGDKIVKSISAASIVAKVTRDRMMMEMHAKYPQYGFDKHKGYGTKLHMDALAKYGPCEIHRQSFAPVTRLLSIAGRKKP